MRGVDDRRERDTSYRTDGDDDVLTLLIARFPEILAVVTKAGCNRNASRWEKTNKYEIPGSAHGSILVPVRTGNGTHELWYTIPFHLQPNNNTR